MLKFLNIKFMLSLGDQIEDELHRYLKETEKRFIFLMWWRWKSFRMAISRLA